MAQEFLAGGKNSANQSGRRNRELRRRGNLSWLQIPTHSGQVFRNDAGRGSDLKPAVIPR
jgi:hypothetical protein